MISQLALNNVLKNKWKSVDGDNHLANWQMRLSIHYVNSLTYFYKVEDITLWYVTAFEAVSAGYSHLCHCTPW